MAYLDSHVQTSNLLPSSLGKGVCGLIVALILGGCQGSSQQRGYFHENLPQNYQPEDFQPEDFQHQEYHHRAMGIEFRIVVKSPQGSDPTSAVLRAFERIDQIEDVASDWKRSSEVRQFCRSAPHSEPVSVSDDLAEILQISRQVHDQTQGRFDVTLGAATRLWRRCFRAERLPSESDLERVKKLCGMQFLEIKGRQARLLKAGIEIDLGGIAKGYAVDKALQVLIESGFPHSLVDGGGDLAFGQAVPGSSGWLIDLSSEVYRFTSPGAVATSGAEARHIEVDGVLFSHILDPKTGLGLSRTVWVTVYVEKATIADAFATAYSVPGRIPEASKLGSESFPRAIRVFDPTTTEVKWWGQISDQSSIPW